MRIRILSDLHREFGPTDIPKLDADLIVLAGDIATKTNGLEWIRSFAGDIPTAYICGNHEFYGAKFPQVREKLQDLTKDTNIHVLEDSFFELNGWFIYGCTLWTDLALHGDWKTGAAEVKQGMNDYKRIRNSAKGYRRLTPEDTRLTHHMSLQRLADFFKNHDPRKTIVVTHHAPSALSLEEELRADPMSCAYASHLDEFIKTHSPRLWIHGHLHHSNDYWIGETRIISNPQGYPDEINSGINWLMSVTL